MMAAMAWALAATVFCNSRMASVSFLIGSESASPMAGADAEVDAAADGGVPGMAGGDDGGRAVEEVEEDRDGEERLDRDTRLSRASNPWVAGPRLRSS